MNLRLPLSLTALLALAGAAFALPEAPSIEAAKPIAKAEGRAILVELTGRDWCPGCIYLKTKILDSAAFEQAVGGKYVLVEVDYPRDPKKKAAVPAEEYARRMELLKVYGVKALPCVLYMDAEGLPYACFTQYTRTPEEYVETIVAQAEAARATRDAAFAKAATLEGMEKAEVLAEGLAALPPVCRLQYRAVLEEMAQLDPQNTLGYSTLLSDAQRREEQFAAWDTYFLEHRAALDAAAGVPENAGRTIAMCEEYLKQPGLLPELRQMVITIISEQYAFQRNIPMVYAATQRALRAAPDSPASEKLRGLLYHYEHFLLDELNIKNEAIKAADRYLQETEDEVKG